MEYNREEALRARRIALKKLESKDFRGAQRIALIAQRLYPELGNLSQLLTVCEVHCAAEAEISGDSDWYGILQVKATADDVVIGKQYNKLSFWLHPDRNTLPGAEAAFKLVSEAHAILCNQIKRSLYDAKRHYVFREVARKDTPLSGSIMVFKAICPHCQKGFQFYR